MEYRDSAGRTRMERPMVTGPAGDEGYPMIVGIFDPVAGRRYILDSASRVAYRTTFAEASRVPKMEEQARRSGLPPTPSARLVSDPEIAEEALGSMTIEGAIAEGRRTTITYPIGTFGNDRSVVVRLETWISRELRIALLGKGDDPRTGESTVRAGKLSRAEPDAALFQVPAGYQVIDAPDTVKIRVIPTQAASPFK